MRRAEPVDPEAFWAGLEPAEDEVVAVGNRFDPDFLYAAYRHGCFPWPAPGWPATPWCSPDPRAVLWVPDLHLPRSLRSRLRRAGWTTTLDAAFGAVVAGCADRPSTWITPELQAAYLALHQRGLAHSVEVWAGGTLVGGLYGVPVGGVFSGESMFCRRPDASKAAVVDLLDRLGAAGGRALDCQQESPHLIRMGQRMVSRRAYRELLTEVRDTPAVLATDRRPVSRLAG